MSQRNVKLMRSAARYYAFLAVQKSRQGRPLNEMTAKDYRDDQYQLQQHYKRALTKMQLAWRDSSDRGRMLLAEEWAKMREQALQKPIVAPVRASGTQE